jgi:hypothetical protein
MNIPHSTVQQKTLYSCLKLHAPKIQGVQALQPDNWSYQKETDVGKLHQIYNDNGFLDKVIFSAQSVSYLCGKVN